MRGVACGVVCGCIVNLDIWLDSMCPSEEYVDNELRLS
jgi:hypothetical protein